MSPVLAHLLVTQRRALLGWVLGVTALAALTLGSWPALEASTEEMSAVCANLPDALVVFLGEGIADFSAAGVVGSRLFGSVAFVIFIGYAISRGARVVAGRRRQGPSSSSPPHRCAAA